MKAFLVCLILAVLSVGIGIVLVVCLDLVALPSILFVAAILSLFYGGFMLLKHISESIFKATHPH